MVPPIGVGDPMLASRTIVIGVCKIRIASYYAIVA
jgi:hypothetical protein